MEDQAIGPNLRARKDTNYKDLHEGNLTNGSKRKREPKATNPGNITMVNGDETGEQDFEDTLFEDLGIQKMAKARIQNELPAKELENSVDGGEAAPLILLDTLGPEGLATQLISQTLQETGFNGTDLLSATIRGWGEKEKEHWKKSIAEVTRQAEQQKEDLAKDMKERILELDQAVNNLHLDIAERREAERQEKAKLDERLSMILDKLQETDTRAERREAERDLRIERQLEEARKVRLTQLLESRNESRSLRESRITPRLHKEEPFRPRATSVSDLVVEKEVLESIRKITARRKADSLSLHDTQGADEPELRDLEDRVHQLVRDARRLAASDSLQLEAGLKAFETAEEAIEDEFLGVLLMQVHKEKKRAVESRLKDLKEVANKGKMLLLRKAVALRPPRHSSSPKKGRATERDPSPITTREWQAYAELPAPWSKMPDRFKSVTSKITGETIAAATFDGNRAGYHQWRSGFIACVHRAAITPDEKMMLLVKHMKEACLKNNNLAALTRYPEYSLENYVKCVQTIEEEFGDINVVLSLQRREMKAFTEVESHETDKIATILAVFDSYEANLAKAGRQGETSAAMFLELMLDRFHRSTLREHLRWRDTKNKPKTTSSLVEWLRTVVKEEREINSVKSTSNTTRRAPVPTVSFAPRIERSMIASKPNTDRPKECLLCKDGHYLPYCEKFKQMKVPERKQTVLGLGACFSCLRKGHIVTKCPSNGRCRTCNNKHHTLLHGDKTNPTNSVSEHAGDRSERQNDEEEIISFVGRATDSLPTRVSMRTVPGFVSKPGSHIKIPINIFLDDGNQCHLLDYQVFKDLKTPGVELYSTIEGVEGQRSSRWRVHTQIQITSWDGRYTDLLSVKAVPKPAGSLEPMAWSELAQQYEHLKEHRNYDPIPGEGIGLMIGQADPELLSSWEEYRGRKGEPIGRLGPLGITIAGPVKLLQREQVPWPFELEQQMRQLQPVQFAGMCTDEVEPPVQPRSEEEKAFARWIGDDTREPWDPKEKAPSPDEEYARQILREGTVLKNKRFQAPVVWKKGEPDLPRNYTQARRRLLALEKSKHFKKPQAKTQYGKKIKEWVEKGYVSRLSVSEHRKGKYYLAHFPVIRQDKTTTKVRPVMDCATREAGKSLNDAVLPGQKLINDLNKVLTRFRKNKVAIGADVSEMFLRIQLDPKDRPYHRFLWRDSPEEDIQEFEFNSHVFGNAGSPYTAIHCVMILADLYHTLYPRASEVISQSTLMDDAMDSVDSVEEAVQVLEQLVKVFEAGGMKLTKFISSHGEVLENFASEDKAPSVTIQGLENLSPSDQVVKALGIIYSAALDSFTFAKINIDELEWSIRKILKMFPRLFDPLGFLIPFIIKARIAFQAIWKRKPTWDQKLPKEWLGAWEDWLKELEDLPKIVIPRRLTEDGEITNQELHVFCDASEKAYGAVAYLLTRYSDRDPTSRMVAARARLAPQSTISMPRLELRAAVLGSMLVEQYAKTLAVRNEDVYCWTDSTTALSWIQNTTRSLKIYAHNRVKSILEETNRENWHWVPTLQNPADHISRGLSLIQLAQSELWKVGPSFTHQPRSEWPQAPTLRTTTEVEAEMKPVEFLPELIFTTREIPDPLDMFKTDKWSNMIRLTALLLRWKAKAQSKPTPTTVGKSLVKDTETGKKYSSQSNMIIHTYTPPLNTTIRPIDPDEYVMARTRIFRLIQDTHMTDLQKILEQHKTVGPKHEYAEVSPTLSASGLIRIEGRLAANKFLPLDQRCPVLVPTDHPVVKILAYHHHVQTCHHVGGADHALDQVLSEIWAKRIRARTKEVVKACFWCRRMKAKASMQRMAPLPDFRLQDQDSRNLPFKTCGVDACGPFEIQMGRGKARHKRWLVLFTCTVYRAVHVEVVHSMDTSSFLAAFQRMTARRPRPDTMVSDNGANFRRGEKELRALWQALERSDVQSRYPLIKWKFNPPGTPHAGGVFERLIRSLKEALVSVMPPGAVTEEELQTAATISEGLLNDRPLTYTSAGPDVMRPITPAMFLGGGAYSNLMPLPDNPKASHFTRRWRKIQTIADETWGHFVRKSAPRLQTRQKWRGEVRDLQVGDVVVSFDEKIRGHWPLGRVEAVHASSRDGHVRSVIVRENGQPRERSLARVALLVPREEEHQQDSE